MKIADVSDTIVLYDVDKVEQFDYLVDKFDLLAAVQKNEDHKVMNGIPVSLYLDILRKQLLLRYDKFKLLVTIDKSKSKVSSFLAAFVVVNDTQKTCCLLYGAYFAPGSMKSILPLMLGYLDSWHGLEDTEFATSRYGPAYERLLKDFDFKLTLYHFKRHVERKQNVQIVDRKSA